MKSAAFIFKTIFVVGVLAVCTFFLLDKFLYLHKPISFNLSSAVHIKAEDGQGSGIVFINGDKTFVWTCHHVISGNIKHEFVMDLANKKISHKFDLKDIIVSSKLFNPDLDECGHVSIKAKILRFSEADDLAVLELSTNDIFKNSVKFPRNLKYIPDVGTKIFHIGSMNGWGGNGGTSEGIHGVRGIDLDGKCYDKVCANFYFGSSGGGVYESWTGTCIGIIARANDRTSLGQGYIIPLRRMYDFAQRLECEWALSRVEIPSDYNCIYKITDDKYTVPSRLWKYVVE